MHPVENAKSLSVPYGVSYGFTQSGSSGGAIPTMGGWLHTLLYSPRGFVILLVVGVALGLVFYTLPTLLAWALGAIHWRGIALLNLLLGWTVLGWIAALLWALFDRPRDLDRDTWPVG